jgi:glyoxylase-like metal-dependent hydrolase (beta-lactamase superfamily II)
MRFRILNRLFLSALLVTAIHATPAMADEDVQIQMIPVRDSIYMLTGQGGNIGISAGRDGILMIDDQYAPLSEKIKTAVASLESGEVKFVLNTHWHGDHTGGNVNFGETATLIAHTNVRKRLSTGQFMKIFKKNIPPAPEAAWPVITFEDAITIHFNGEEVSVMHFPEGHTDGDSVIYFTKSNVLHIGDHMFKDRFPFIDLDSGGSVDGYIQNVERMMDEINEDTLIIPGHGDLASKEDLKIFHAMLQQTSHIIRSKMDEGMSLGEIQSAGLGAKWDDWGKGFISETQWIDIIYEDYR